MVIQGKIARLTEVQICYGMEMNVEKTKVMRISRQPSPLQTTTDQKRSENVEYFNNLVALYQMVHDIHVKFNQDYHGNNIIQKGEDFSPANCA